jgi:hypothetical protein
VGAHWDFSAGADEPEAITHVQGPAYDLCRVAARRVPASQTALLARGPDADAVLELVRTFA